MALTTALIYWVIIVLWVIVLGALLVAYIRNPRVFGTTRLLLGVVLIDTIRNIVENVYFGVYFGGQYGLFSSAVVGVLGNPYLLIIPKVTNVVAGCVVISLLLLRWLPSAIKEHDEAELNVRDARELNVKMDEFVANVSHELRTPLTSIAGSLALLAGGASGVLPPRAIRLVSIAHTNAQRLVRLVNDILDIGKIDSGNMMFDMRQVDLRMAAEQAIDNSRGYAEVYGATVRFDASSSACMVRADSDRLTQVLTNLLSNAIKFSPQGGEVVVTVLSEERVGRLLVRDHGPGIPEEFKQRIFEKFTQAGTGDARQKSGSGLGLNIVAKIMIQHGGSVGFEDAAGGGTTFYVDVPLWRTGTLAGEDTRPTVVDDLNRREEWTSDVRRIGFMQAFNRKVEGVFNRRVSRRIGASGS